MASLDATSAGAAGGRGAKRAEADAEAEADAKVAGGQGEGAGAPAEVDEGGDEQATPKRAGRATKAESRAPTAAENMPERRALTRHPRGGARRASA